MRRLRTANGKLGLMSENERVIVLHKERETLIGYGTANADGTVRLDDGRVVNENDVMVRVITSDSGRHKWKGCL